MKTLPLGLLSVLLVAGPYLRLNAFPEQMDWSNHRLEKSGESQVSLLRFIKLFEAALFLEEGYATEDYPGEFCYALSIRYQKNFRKEQLIKSASLILEDLHQPESLDPLQLAIQKINSAYVDVKEGDVYTLIYQPKRGTTLLYNGVEQITIPGRDFAEIYFSIWLGGHPRCEQLREDLLNS